MTNEEALQLLNDPTYPSDRARSRELAKRIGISESAAQTRITRFRTGLHDSVVFATPALRRGPWPGPTASLPQTTQFTVYCIECETENHFYVGQSGNVERRFAEHKNGNGSQFTMEHGVKNTYIVATTTTRAEALKVELLLYLRLKKFMITVSGNDYKEREGKMNEYQRSHGY